MNKFYCTFGTSHRNSEYVQPIYANREVEAISSMTRLHGSNWGFCYSEDIFNHNKQKGVFNNLIEFQPIYTEKVMTFGEMQKLMQRLNQILGAAQYDVMNRLENLYEDIYEMYEVDNQFATGLREVINWHWMDRLCLKRSV